MEITKNTAEDYMRNKRMIESTYSKIVNGVKCCQFGDEEDVNCSECRYCGEGCGYKLKEDLLRFLDFFSTEDKWAEALGLKRFVIGGEQE